MERNGGQEEEEEEDEEKIKNSPEVQQFVQKLAEKGYFNGCVEGTPEYEERKQRAVQKYIERIKSNKAKEASGNASEAHVVIDVCFALEADDCKSWIGEGCRNG